MLSLLTHRLAGSIASGVALLLALALGWQTLQLNGARGVLKAAKADLVTVRADLKQCKVNRVTLQAALSAQNDAVTALKREGDARVAASQKAVVAAQKTAEAYRKDAARILASTAGADKCKAASDLIEEFAQ